jgi:hypothetical protein
MYKDTVPHIRYSEQACIWTYVGYSMRRAKKNEYDQTGVRSQDLVGVNDTRYSGRQA